MFSDQNDSPSSKQSDLQVTNADLSFPFFFFLHHFSESLPQNTLCSGHQPLVMSQFEAALPLWPFPSKNRQMRQEAERGLQTEG